jgi:hypothetical protein
MGSRTSQRTWMRAVPARGWQLGGRPRQRDAQPAGLALFNVAQIEGLSLQVIDDHCDRSAPRYARAEAALRLVA